MKTRKILALVLSLVMVLGLCGTAFAAHTTDEVTELEIQNSDTSEWLAEQSYVLLENNGVLPIAKEGAVALFGSASEYTIKGGTGSGDVNQRAHDNIDEAFVAAGYEIANPTWMAKMEAQPTQGGCMGSSPKNDMEITDEELAEAVANTDTAVYAIARNAGEGSDRQVNSGNGRYTLTALELENIGKICDAFENVIVVYNTLVMDTAWQADFDIDAVVFMCNGGQRGSEALVNVLNGTVNPSGKVTDTWALQYSDYPAAAEFARADGNINTEWYSEGIYMGYRYFDTFGLDVKYPFGYGLSYTDFQIDVLDVTADAEEVTVEAAVTNKGDTYSGKEVVEVYFSAPDGELEKPYQELAAYGKTDELAPGKTQFLTLHFATTDMSSYSEERASYIMDAGDYIIRVGNSSRNTKAVAVITLDELAVTEIMYNQFALENDSLDELSKAGATPIANNDAAELADAIKIELAAEDIVPVDYRDNINDSETITTYLFAEDAEEYTPREEITLTTKRVAGIINNAQYPDGDGRVNNNGPAYNGYSSTTYSEVVEVVDPLPEGITKENAKLTDVLKGTITLKQFVACLTAEELARLCVGGAGTIIETPDGNQVGAAATSVQGGAGQTTSQFIETRHIPSMPNADGPAGVRITQHYNRTVDGERVDYYQFCTAFPVGTNIAQTWDIDAYKAFGIAYGSEMKEYGVTTCLCPGMDMHRDPLCGRNFEYYSEDPLVAGLSAAGFTAGVQSYDGIGVCLKHFFGNEQEDNRNSLNNVIGERAAREIYLKQFEIAVRLARPQTMMNCYNENNGWPGSDSWDLNEDVLRGEWGFTGYVMTDWGGGQSTAYVAKHGGCDMVMPGGNANVILQGYNINKPTFNADGSIRNAGNFVVQHGGSVEIVVPSDVESEEFLPEVVATAVANEEARYDKYGDDATITWYGEYNMLNKICLGDLQKSAMSVLGVALLSQDMEGVMAAIGEQYTAGSYSENNDAPLANGYTPVEKSEPIDLGIHAEKVVVDTVADKAVSADVWYDGDVDITTARMTLVSALPIKDIESDYDFEYNEDTNEIIVYDGAGDVIDGVLFTINYEFDAVIPDGEYPIDLEILEVTDADSAVMYAVAFDGAIIVDNNYPIGDVTQDGEVDNRDLILIARYLVHLVEFNEKQKIAADFDESGAINNTDLVLIARYIVSLGD
jgi:beta-glucosidase